MIEECAPGTTAPNWGYDFDRSEDRDVATCDACGQEVELEYVPGLRPVDLIATHPQPSDNPPG